MKRGYPILLLLASSVALYGQFTPANPEWNRVVEPFRIVGNMYYVGASDVSAFLLTTPEGHLLIDTGFAATVPLIENNLTKLGFSIKDIRILLSSHAHYDHAGGLAELKSRTNARFFANPIEADLFSRGGKGDFAFGDTYPFPPVEPDEQFTDGGKITLGAVVVEAHFTPGHTKGCTSYTTTVQEGENKYRVVIPCSLTAPGYRLVDNPSYPDIVEDFESTFVRLKALPCDIFLGAHSWDFGLAEKFKARAGTGSLNPFVDPAGYRRWLERAQETLRIQLENQRNVAARAASPPLETDRER